MSFFKSHFRYTKSQKKGILLLVFLLLLFQFIYFFVDFSSEEVSLKDKLIVAKFEKEYDSLSKLKTKDKKPKFFLFNPNFISDFKGSQLGMSVAEIDRLHTYRATGKYVNSPKEFQAVTKVSDSLLLTVKNYFKFPSWVAKKKKLVTTKRKVTTTNLSTTDLNQATVKDLQTINGVSFKLASRIVKYRKKIQGFTFTSQLKEVYYLNTAVAVNILKVFSIQQKPSIQKLNVNEATFKQILHTPYINYELTKKILNYRDEVAEIQSIEELKKIDGFPLEKYNLIALYLQAK